MRTLGERFRELEAVLETVRQYRNMSKVKNDKPTLH